MYFETFRQFTKQLRQLDHCLDRAATYAKEKNFDPNVLAGQRLAPDQFPLTRQVQIACDTAKLGSSRLTGKEAPKHDDSETTLEQLRARVQSVIVYLEGHSAADFEGAATRVITQPRWENKMMHGADYFLEHVVPNFYFHYAHTYAILRHNGVPLGKRDYLGPLSMKDR
jgi:uncharacterized protein